MAVNREVAAHAPRTARRRVVLFVANVLIYLRHAHLVVRFRKRVGHFPNVAHPGEYQELIFWRKVFDRNPVYARFCDKLATKDYIREKAPDLRLAKTLWVGDRLDDEAHALLEQGAVLKANHGCNFNYIPARDRLDRAAVERLARKWMGRHYNRRNYEYLYSKARRTLFIEEFLSKPGARMIEIQARVVDGEPFLLSSTTNQKTENERIAYFDLDGNRRREMEIGKDGWEDDAFEVPASYREVIRQCAALGAGLDYVRADFFDLGGELYGGEITVYPTAGLSANDRKPDGLTRTIASRWNLRLSHFFTVRHGPLIELYKRALLEALDAEGR